MTAFKKSDWRPCYLHALWLPISFAGYITLGFCGFTWHCLPDIALILAVPSVCLSFWFHRLGTTLVWMVFALAGIRLLARQPFSPGLVVITLMLLVAALLVQFATQIAAYIVGDEGRTRNEPV